MTSAADSARAYLAGSRQPCVCGREAVVIHGGERDHMDYYVESCALHWVANTRWLDLRSIIAVKQDERWFGPAWLGDATMAPSHWSSEVEEVDCDLLAVDLLVSAAIDEGMPVARVEEREGAWLRLRREMPQASTDTHARLWVEDGLFAGPPPASMLKPIYTGTTPRGPVQPRGSIWTRSLLELAPPSTGRERAASRFLTVFTAAIAIIFVSRLFVGFVLSLTP